MSVRHLGYEESLLEEVAEPEGVTLYEPTLEVAAVPERAPRATREIVFMISFLTLVAIFIAFI